jgi:hypothetical protein
MAWEAFAAELPMPVDAALKPAAAAAACLLRVFSLPNRQRGPVAATSAWQRSLLYPGSVFSGPLRDPCSFGNRRWNSGGGSSGWVRGRPGINCHKRGWVSKLSTWRHTLER